MLRRDLLVEVLSVEETSAPDGVAARGLPGVTMLGNRPWPNRSDMPEHGARDIPSDV